jgi:hypothetical protein
MRLGHFSLASLLAICIAVSTLVWLNTRTRPIPQGWAYTFGWPADVCVVYENSDHQGVVTMKQWYPWGGAIDLVLGIAVLFACGVGCELCIRKRSRWLSGTFVCLGVGLILIGLNLNPLTGHDPGYRANHWPLLEKPVPATRGWPLPAYSTGGSKISCYWPYVVVDIVFLAACLVAAYVAVSKYSARPSGGCGGPSVKGESK